ncbi:glycosyltransferase family 2 protein [Sulfitobacter sp. 915]|uniref:glycosyltransferase family 2 protein n=1 Tax=Sulfitobacter sp. 915 TaxID=3368558 RepID=UPI003745BA7C
MDQLVSVVIPTFERPKLLAQALRSVCNQTYRNLEILIVDDGLCDVSEALCLNVADSRIHYMRTRGRQGGNAARNIGLQLCKGDFVAFLDDDDEWYPRKIEAQVRVFNANTSLGLVYTGVEFINSQGVSHKTYPTRRGDLSGSILSYNYIGTTSSVMVAAKAIVKVGPFDEALPQLQDYDLWIRVCQRYNVDYVSDVMVRYRLHENKKQISNSVANNLYAIQRIDDKYEELINKLPRYQRRWRFSLRYNSMGKRNLYVGNSRSARRLFIKGFVHFPNLESGKFFLASFLGYKASTSLRTLAQRFKGAKH